MTTVDIAIATLKRRPDLVSALVVASVAGMVLLAYRAANPANGVEYFYKLRHRPLFHLIQLCNVALMAALAFNARFLVLELVAWGGRVVMAA